MYLTVKLQSWGELVHFQITKSIFCSTYFLCHLCAEERYIDTSEGVRLSWSSQTSKNVMMQNGMVCIFACCTVMVYATCSCFLHFVLSHVHSCEMEFWCALCKAGKHNLSSLITHTSISTPVISTWFIRTWPVSFADDMAAYSVI